MNNKLLFFLMINSFCILCSCNDTKTKIVLQRAESAWMHHADSLAIYLKQIDKPEGLKDEFRARYAMLQAKNDWLNNNQYSEKTNSLLQDAFQHYVIKNDSLNQFYILYWQAQLYRKAHKYSESIRYFEESQAYIPADSARFISELKLIIGYSFLDAGKPDSALLQFKELISICENQENWWIWLAAGRAYNAMNNQPDSTLFCYNKSLEQLAESENNDYNSFLLNELSAIYAKAGLHAEALRVAREAKAARINRNEVPKLNLMLGELFLSTQQTDSSFHYLTLAAQGNNPYISSVAYQQLSILEEQRFHPEQALNYQRKHKDVYTERMNMLDVREREARYQEKLLRLENEQLIIHKQRHELYITIIALIALFILWTAIWIYRIQRKKSLQREQQQKELLLKEKTIRLENENLLLKQQNELNALREKDAILRESLFRKMSLSQKIPSLTGENEPADDSLFVKTNKHIQLTDEDCEEMVRIVNEAYDDFVQRLQQNYPLLNSKDLIFCCLIKMKINMKDLSDIYCVSKAAITKKKQRLKNEKFGLSQSILSLDQYLDTF